MFILAFIFALLFSVSIALRFPKLSSTQKFAKSSTKYTICQANDLTIRDLDDLTIRDIDSLSTKDILRAIHSTGVNANQLFGGVDIVKSSPGINKFIIGNPKIFYNKKKLSKLYFDNEFDDLNMPLSSIARMLPVIYIADVHPEYGTVGFLLNKPSGRTMYDLNPALKYLRSQKTYLGGVQNRGSSFTMVHQKIGFPENRAWKKLPGQDDFRLYFSPDVAMANELCATKDALPREFKFFEFATVWPPNQIGIEYEQRMWLTISAPSKVIFEDESDTCPLWRRLVCSLPADRLS